MSADTRRLQPETDDDFVTAQRHIHRNDNIKKILSVIGALWPMGGVDDEGDTMSGSTRFWARRSSKVAVIFFEIPNGALNGGFLTVAAIRTLLGGDHSAESVGCQDQLCPAAG